MARDIPSNLPEFENPPVIEVVFGVQFAPLERLKAPHVGYIWDLFKSSFPNYEEKPELAPRIEEFNGPSGQAAPSLQLYQTAPLPRVWFVSSSNNQIIQIQRNRFHYNWKKAAQDEEYPRYHSVRDNFKNYLSLFTNYIDDNEIGDIEITQCELTYVNHIQKGNGWTDIQDIRQIFPDFTWKLDSKRFLPCYEAMNWGTSFHMPDHSGRLHATIQSAQKSSNGDEIIRFELTARGMIENASIEQLWEWFDVAREWIVRGFADLTGKEIQQTIWKRTQ